MNLFSEPVTALMLRLVIATIIGVTLGLCSLEQATHSAKKAGELIGIIGGMQSFGLLDLLLGPVIMAALLTIWREWIGGEE